jgi:hypothetical protein
MVDDERLDGLTGHGLEQGQLWRDRILEGVVSIPVITLLFALLSEYVPEAQICRRAV